MRPHTEAEGRLPDGALPASLEPAGGMKPSGWLESRFGLTERGTTARTEILAGVTTFLTMAYIVLVNPAILGQAGMPVAAVAAATCLAAGFASILMGLVSNTPLALAPGMGLNAYFSFTVVQQMHVPWPIAMACVFVSGIIFLLLTFVGLRQLIVATIPPHLLAATAGGIGLFIGFIGLRNAGIVVSNPATSVALGDLRAAGPALALLGLLIIAGLSVWGMRGAVLIGIVVTTIVGALLGLVPFTPQPYDLTAIGQVAFKADIPGMLGLTGTHGIGLFEILFVFLFVDLFDNIGTLVAVTKRAGLIGPDGKIPGINRILTVDAISTIFGSFAGTTTVTSYVESAAGVQAGGRTGLTAVVVGILFLATMFVAPFAQLIPLAATAPALILVGGLMMAPLVEIAWDDPMEAIPCFLTLAIIPLSFSIANGLAFGITAYAALKIARGQARRSDLVLFVLAVLFVIRFVYLSAG